MVQRSSSSVNAPFSQPGTKWNCVHSCPSRAWGCIGLRYRSSKTRTQHGVTQIRAVTTASQNTERSAQDNQLLWYRRCAAPEVRQCEHISTSDNSQSTIVSHRGTTLALALLSMAAVACWCTPVYAETSVQAAEQVAQQLTSANSGSLSWLGDTAFREGLVSGFLLILFSELGDKTFFIALLLALKKNKGIVFAGTFGALAIMTVISVLLGQVLHQVDELLPSSSLPFDDIAAAFLLVFFGIKTLQEASETSGSVDEEKEAQEEVQRLDSGAATGLLLSTFALVFAAEWGDKSFLATIALSAASSPVGVVAGAVTGHGVATLIAILGGSVLGQYLNEKVVQYVGGSMFLVFAGITAFDVYKTISTG